MKERNSIALRENGEDGGTIEEKYAKYGVSYGGDESRI